jgi:tetraacyldisaccharide 4'-kinase
MGRTRRWEDILFGGDSPWWLEWLLSPLLLASWVYGIVVRVRAALYRCGVAKRAKLPVRIVSVGNLTVGGTGKTPLVIYLARALHAGGLNVAVVARGYGGSKEKTGGVVSDGSTVFMTPAEAGDEPVMVAGELSGIPMLVGRRRAAIGLEAKNRFGTDVLILDDAFQHMSVEREVDIVLVDGRNGFGNARLFPRGPLREPLSALRRASCVIVTKVHDSVEGKDVEKAVSRAAPAVPCFRTRYRAARLIEMPSGRNYTPAYLTGKRVATLAGIADPGYFAKLVTDCGGRITASIHFPDHHRYNRRDLQRVRDRSLKGDIVVTTKKDYVKLRALPLEGLVFFVLEVEQEILNEDVFMAFVLAGLHPDTGSNP